MNQSSLTDIIQSILHNEPQTQFAESINNYLHYRTEKISSDLLQLIWNRVANGMIIIDADGNIVAVNRAFCSLSQMTESELKGFPFTNIHNDLVDRKRLFDDYRERLRSRSFEPFKEQYIHFNSGKVAEVEVLTSILTDDADEVFVFCEFQEIGIQKEMEQRLKESVDNLQMIRQALVQLAGKKEKQEVPAMQRSYPLKGLVDGFVELMKNKFQLLPKKNQ